MAVAISDIGKEVRSILYGAKDGVFQYDQKLSYSTRTADGVQLVLNAIRKDEKADLSLRTVYNYGNYGLNATFTTSDKVHVLASLDKIAPGVKVSLSATLPDKESGKLLVDYINQVGSRDGCCSRSYCCAALEAAAACTCTMPAPTCSTLLDFIALSHAHQHTHAV
eukprot:GHRQ01014731.1.p1 GENE.GHRQ01014731.1~~GHRQ01014731.1.p1  ORF type:complete len:166 (-),score=68.25 GHRQ01014731.1:81-578(-)